MFLSNFADTVAAKQRHLQDTLSGYGRSVVREMRALAAERDKTLIHTDVNAQGIEPAVVEDEKKSADGKSAKTVKPAKKKVAHIVDKMLFNYRNIGKKYSLLFLFLDLFSPCLSLSVCLPAPFDHFVIISFNSQAFCTWCTPKR